MRKDTNYEDMNKNENRILSAVKNRLVKDYGYPVSLIEEEYSLSKTRHVADLVVFDSSKKDKILIVVEVKSGDFVIALGKAQLQNNMKKTNAKYGILTNNDEYLFFEKINNDCIQIADIPKKKKSTKVELKPIPNPSNFVWQLFEQYRDNGIRAEDFANNILKILVSKFVDEHDSHKVNHMKKFVSSDDHENYLLLQDMWTFAKDKYPILIDEEIRIEPKHATILIHMLKDFTVSKSNLSEIAFAILSKIQNHQKMIPDPHQEIIDLMLELSDIHSTDSILIPFTGQGNTLFSLQNYLKEKNSKKQNKIVFVERTRELANQSNMLMILLGMTPSVKFHDPLIYETDDMFDKILFFNTPFGQKIERNSDMISGDYTDNLIFRLSKRVKSGGSVVALLPQGFLFDSRKQKLRRYLLDEFHVHAIIKPPQGVFYPSFNVNTAIVILEKESQKSTTKSTFVAELEGKYSRNVSTNELQFTRLLSDYKEFRKTNLIKNQSKTGFLTTISHLQENWDIHFTLELKEKLSEIKNPTKLLSLAEIISGKSILEKSVTGTNTSFLRISDLQNKLITDTISKSVLVSESILKRQSMPRIKPDDVIISRQATIGKTAIVTSKHDGALLSPQLIALRTNSKILPEYLLYVLSLDTTKEQLSQMVTGHFIQALSAKSLKNLIIPLPSISEQQKIVNKFSKSLDKIQSLEEQLSLLKSQLSKNMDESD